MTIAYVLVTTEVGAEEEVRNKLLKEPEIMEADVVFGVYDLVVKIKADSMEQVRKVVTWKIRRIDKVTSTQTLIVATET